MMSETTGVEKRSGERNEGTLLKNGVCRRIFWDRYVENLLLLIPAMLIVFVLLDQFRGWYFVSVSTSASKGFCVIGMVYAWFSFKGMQKKEEYEFIMTLPTTKEQQFRMMCLRTVVMIAILGIVMELLLIWQIELSLKMDSEAAILSVSMQMVISIIVKVSLCLLLASILYWVLSHRKYKVISLLFGAVVVRVLFSMFSYIVHRGIMFFGGEGYNPFYAISNIWKMLIIPREYYVAYWKADLPEIPVFSMAEKAGLFIIYIVVVYIAMFFFYQRAKRNYVMCDVEKKRACMYAKPFLAFLICITCIVFCGVVGVLQSTIYEEENFRNLESDDYLFNTDVKRHSLSSVVAKDAHGKVSYQGTIEELDVRFWESERFQIQTSQHVKNKFVLSLVLGFLLSCIVMCLIWYRNKRIEKK